MKKYVMITLCVVALGDLYAETNKRLVKAIKLQDRFEVKRALAASFAPTQKEKDAYLEKAHVHLEECEENVTLWKSKRDLGKLVAGTGVGVLGLGVLGGGLFVVLPEALRKDLEPTFCAATALLIGLGVSFSGLGGYIAYKGYQCSSALANVEKAEAIKEAIAKEKTVEEKQNETVEVTNQED